MHSRPNLSDAVLEVPLASFINPAESLTAAQIALLDLADPGLDSRIAILAPRALELACLLIRRGNLDVSIVRPGERPRAREADVVIVPQISGTEHLERAVTCAARLLGPLGTLVIGLDAASPPDLVEARRRLLMHGFSSPHTRTVDGEVLLRAELPLHGRLTCA